MAIAIVAGGVLSCKKIKCDEEAPGLQYDTLMLNSQRDTLVFQTKFEDCQGDIGHIGPIDSNTIRSVRTYLYEQIDGEWLRWYPDNLADTVGFFSVIPGSKKNREGWLLKGVVIQKFGLANLRQNSDTIRFRTYIIDQAGNRSNNITSPPFIFPPQ